MEKRFTIGEFSRLSFVSAHTLRYYDRIGLLKPRHIDPRTRYRYYTYEDFMFLDTIKYMRKIGMPLDEIRQHFENRSVEETLELYRKRLVEAEAKLKELTDIKNHIEKNIGYLEKGKSLKGPHEPRLIRMDERRAIIASPSEDDGAPDIGDPFDTGAGFNMLIGSIILLAAVRIRKGGLKIKKEDWPRVLICGAAAMSLYFTLENYGIQLTSASFGSLVLSTVPIFGIIGDRIFYKRKITGLKIICIAVSIAGVYILVASELENSGLAGLAFTLAAAVMWAFQIVYVKPLYDKYDMLTILTGLFVSGAVIQVPVTLVSGFHFEITAASVTVTILTTIICLIIGEAGYLFAIGNLSVTTVSAFENLIPVTTIILSFLIYGAMLSSSQLIGAILIIGSVMCIALRE